MVQSLPVFLNSKHGIMRARTARRCAVERPPLHERWDECSPCANRNETWLLSKQRPTRVERIQLFKFKKPKACADATSNRLAYERMIVNYPATCFRNPVQGSFETAISTIVRVEAAMTPFASAIVQWRF